VSKRACITFGIRHLLPLLLPLPGSLRRRRSSGMGKLRLLPPWYWVRLTTPKPMVNAMAVCVDMLEGAAPIGRISTLGSGGGPMYSAEEAQPSRQFGPRMQIRAGKQYCPSIRIRLTSWT
jgi:hypothetical protein